MSEVKEIKGKLFAILEEVNGESSNGKWRKQEIVIETDGQYPKKVCLSLWGDTISQLTQKKGDDISVYFDIESREYNGRWYTEARAWKINVREQQASKPAPNEPQNESQEETDLPF